MGYAKGERRQAAAAGLDPRACVTCEVEFQPYRRTQIACSRICRDKQPEKLAVAKAWRDQPEVKERQRSYRRMDTTPDQEWLRALNLKNSLRRYGVTVEWYERTLSDQGGACILCGAIPPADGVKAASRLHVDHDHKTGKVRDLLCTRCNMGVGYFMDDPEVMRRAAEYVERHRT